MNTLLLIGRQHRRFGRQLGGCFFSSTANQDLVLTNVDEDTGVAILMLNRPPANSLSLEMNDAICTSIKDIEANSKIQSLIVSSANPTIFSAGLDVSELVAPDEDRLPKFWNSLQQIFVDLYGSRLATVAAIDGHAPAAGCFLAMSCDYRVMSAGDAGDEGRKKHVPTIGLNETKLGIAAPPWMGQLLVRTVGFRQAELALAMGTLFPPDEALEVGLVDEVVRSSATGLFSDESHCDALLELLPHSAKDKATNRVIQKAYTQAKMYAKIPPPARVASKLVTRDEHIKDMIDKRERDTDYFCGFITQNAVQSNLTAYVEALKRKSKKT